MDEKSSYWSVEGKDRAYVFRNMFLSPFAKPKKYV